MTDRYHSLTVVLDHDIREDDAQTIVDAVGMIKGVLSVTGNVSDLALHTAVSRAGYKLGDLIIETIVEYREDRQ